MKNEEIAKICHEMNRRWCQLTGDDSQPAWEDAPEWQRRSAVLGVEYHVANPSSTSEDSHVRWSNEKARDGWVYGPVKDPVAKTHPCLVDYCDLPATQRVKDTFFLAVVRALE